MLTLVRLALAPVFVACARLGTPGWILALLLVAGFASDILDGVVARRYAAITPFLRRLDSAVDTIFYLAVAYAAWMLYPLPLRLLAWPIAVVLAGEAANYVAAMAITLVLPAWRHDVPSLWHAHRLRREKEFQSSAREFGSGGDNEPFEAQTRATKDPHPS